MTTSSLTCALLCCCCCLTMPHCSGPDLRCFALRTNAPSRTSDQPKKTAHKLLGAYSKIHNTQMNWKYSITMGDLKRVLRLSRRWCFKSSSCGLWLHDVTTHKTSNWNGGPGLFFSYCIRESTENSYLYAVYYLIDQAVSTQHRMKGWLWKVKTKGCARKRSWTVLSY
jgi:hypothetical protein